MIRTVQMSAVVAMVDGNIPTSRVCECACSVFVWQLKFCFENLLKLRIVFIKHLTFSSLPWYVHDLES